MRRPLERQQRTGAGPDVQRKTSISSRDSDRVEAPSGATHDALRLQQILGNRLTRQLLAREATESAERDSNGVMAGAETAVTHAARSTSEPLPAAVQNRFEGSLGVDLSQVRIHNNAASAQAARAVGAKAYTVGQDIHFASGFYAPHESAGLHLLAHEVAHTVQNGGGGKSDLQPKLEVSTPADPAELEADRTADLMVQQSSASVEANPSTSLHRDGDPAAKTDTTPSAPVPAPPPSATNQPPAAATTDQVTANWSIDWRAKEVGAPITAKPNARTGKDAAYGTLKITPAGTNATTLFPWVNAASSGAVAAGSMSHPKGKGGKISSSIAYGKPPSVTANVTVSASADADKKVKPGATQIEAKKKAAVAAVTNKLSQDLESMGNLAAIQSDLEAAAKDAVGAPPEGYSYDVAVGLRKLMDPTEGNPRAVSAIDYDSFPENGTRVAIISVATETQKLKGTAAVEAQTKDSESSGKQTFNKDEKKEEHLDETTVTLINKISTSFSSAFQSSWEDLKQKATKDAGSLSGGFSGKVDAGGSTDVSVKDFKVDLGKLAGVLLIENPVVALALSKALGTATLGGELKTSLAGSLSAHGDAKKEWSTDEVKRTLSKFDQQVSNLIQTEVSSQVTTQVKNSKSELKVKEQSGQKAESHDKQKKVASATETIGVKYIVGEPSMTVEKN